MFATTSVITTAAVPVAATVPLPAPGDHPADPGLFVCVASACHSPAPRLDIARHFADLPDPRHRAFRDRHLLGDILVIAFCAVLCGAKSWQAIAAFGVAKQTWFRCLGLQLPNGIPSHDTFGRIFAAVDPLAFQHSFTSWINSVCATLGLCHIPIDGKASRGVRGPDGTPLHLVSAWAAQQRLSLAQVAVADKSNEITAIPEVLRMLDLTGALVSIDAIGCQKGIAGQVIDQGGDYLLQVKENQPTLYHDIQAMLDEAMEADFAVAGCTQCGGQEEVGHGRTERRSYTLFTDLSGLTTRDEWAGLKAVLVAARERQVGGKVSSEVAFYISSSALDVAALGGCARGHWGIENRCHWVLDVVFAEDRNRTRQGNAGENLAWLRKMALSLFGQDQTKGSIPTRQFRAAADDDYRLHLLSILNS
jgi:predicted transposase YbfD/YdcC